MKKQFLQFIVLSIVFEPLALLASSGEHHQEVPPSIPIHVWFHLLNLCILLYFLIKWARPAVSNYLIKRHDTIRDVLERSQKLEQAAVAKNLVYEERLKTIDQEILALKKQAEEDAKKESLQIVANAKKMADRILADSERMLKEELERARYQIKKESVELAVESARSVIVSKITPQDHEQIAEKYLHEMKRSMEVN